MSSFLRVPSPVLGCDSCYLWTKDGVIVIDISKKIYTTCPFKLPWHCQMYSLPLVPHPVTHCHFRKWNKQRKQIHVQTLLCKSISRQNMTIFVCRSRQETALRRDVCSAQTTPNRQQISDDNHTSYLSFVLHRQYFWSIKFTPKNA